MRCPLVAARRNNFDKNLDNNIDNNIIKTRVEVSKEDGSCTYSNLINKKNNNINVDKEVRGQRYLEPRKSHFLNIDAVSFTARGAHFPQDNVKPEHS